MKRLIFMLVLLGCVLTTWAQQYTVRRCTDGKMIHLTDSMTYDNDPHLFKAGKYLERSVYYDIFSWGAFGASAVCYISAFSKDDESSSSMKSIGLTCALVGVVAKIYSVSYKFGAGTELKMSAGYVQVTF